MPNKRMTDLKLEQIRDLLQKKMLGPEKDLLVPIGVGILQNEIGIIFLNGNREVEDDLVSLLDYSIGSRLAYYYLFKRRNQLRPANLALLEKFEKNRFNAGKIDYVRGIAKINHGR